MKTGDAQEHRQAVDFLDWQAFRILSIQPHGFRHERTQIWPKLLHVDKQMPEDNREPADDVSIWTEVLEQPASDLENIKHGSSHSDEHQIELDTERSFVLYPVDGVSNREKLQAALNRLIVSLFRRRPHLHYFQGYHDIVSVILLTLPRELHIPVVEKLSLHRLRDSMGTNLDPVVGLLRLLKRLLHLADADYAATLERTASLPYYSLSNLLTLFSHDVPTLPLIQHIFDYLLSRPPITIVYLAAALILTRRQEVQLLEDEGEEGMLHSLLTVIPDLYEESEGPVHVEAAAQAVLTSEPSAVKAGAPHVDGLATSPDEKTALESGAKPMEQPHQHPPSPSFETQDEDVSREWITPEQPDPAVAHPELAGDSFKAEEEVEPAVSIELPPDASDNVITPVSPSRSIGAHEDITSVVPKETDADPDDIESSSASYSDSLPRPAIKAGSPESSSSVPPPSDKHDGKVSEERTSSPDPPEHEPRPHRPRISLTALLTQADELFTLYPPTHPAIALSSVMGPQSVMLTWSERASDLPDDDEAELMVTRPELIVFPHVEADGEPGDDASDYSEKDRRRMDKGDRERRRRKLRKPRRLTDMVVQRKTIVAGAVLVLGVAVAVYGLNGGLPGAGGGHHRSGLGRELKKFGKLLGGAITVVPGKVLDGIRRGLE